MDITALSESLLRRLHETVRGALRDDDSSPLPPEDKTYGVRLFPDWRQAADDLETELNNRGLDYTPIAWELPFELSSAVNVTDRQGTSHEFGSGPHLVHDREVIHALRTQAPQGSFVNYPFTV